MRTSQKITYQIILVQLTAIFIWLLISVIQWSNNPKSSPGFILPIIIRGTEAFSLWLISGLLIVLFEKFKISLQQLYIIIILLPGLYLASLLTNIISLNIRNMIGYAPPPVDGYFFIQSLHFYIPLVLVIVFYGVYKYQSRAQIAKENNLKAEASAQQAKWLMLRYQVNPHFLFNALNSIRALVGKDDNQARNMITELSEYFRYTLSKSDDVLVKIKDELEAVMNYLEIQKIRFGDKIKIENAIDEKANDGLIPIFSIQTLIENAVKYGIKTSETPLKIMISTQLKKESLTIKVKNSGKLISADKLTINSEGTGVGLNNLKDRLKQLYQGKSQFKLYEQDDYVIAEVNIPKNK